MFKLLYTTPNIGILFSVLYFLCCFVNVYTTTTHTNTIQNEMLENVPCSNAHSVSECSQNAFYNLNGTRIIELIKNENSKHLCITCMFAL